MDSDNRLFIDPVLLELSKDPWCEEANKRVKDYFDCFYQELKSGFNDTSLFEHAHEQNATKLGYGNGRNGKGKTKRGMYESLKKLSLLVQDIPTIDRAYDIPTLIEGFAEDNMSDLLTNILHEMLNQFTCEQMNLYGIQPQGNLKFWTWNREFSTWTLVERPSWFYDGRELLLVPKWIVRKNYLFKAHQYLYGVIIERIQVENGWQDLTKYDIWQNMPRRTEHWEYETVVEYSKDNPHALIEYHNRIPYYYRRAHGQMTDEDLDIAIYGCVKTEVA